ncbi:MAG: gliding motility-associated protein GldE [Bacteroidota bacterium]|nr:gliding motility-associated protein GldE [Bacteroidota bacterium]
MYQPALITTISEYFSFILLAINPQGTTFLVISLLALMLLTFTISGAEAALFSLSSKDVNMLKTKQHTAAKRIINLLEERKEVYTSLLIASTFFNICIIVLANFLINSLIHLGKFHFIISIDLDLLVKIILIVFMLVFFGEVLPKVWASQNKIRFAYGSSFVVEALHLLLRRISKWMVSIADVIGRQLGATRIQKSSLDELDNSEGITTEEKNILTGIEKFGNISVKQIMRARLDVSGIEHNISFGDLVKKVEELHYSRLPVYKNTLDDIVGIINTKDLITHLDENENFHWQTLMRQPYFVPESKLIEYLLKDFQSRRVHFAVVVDEFGGTSGIVTLEDILEEIIGEIKDEFDEEETGIRKLDDHNYIFVGKTMIHDACKAMQLPTDTFDKVRGESESMGGLILELAGEFPHVNEIISSGDFDFTVIETDKNRILQLKITLKARSLKL